MAQEADLGPVLRAVLGQLDVWWWGAVTNHMAGLTDDQFFWRPTPDAFCLRREGDALFYEWPPGSRGETTPPVTTIAWRLAHVAQGCFMARWHTYFGDGMLEDWTAQPFPATAAGALRYLEEWKTKWCDALRAAGEQKLWEPLTGIEGDVPYMQLGVGDPFIGIVLHVNREVMHHGAEICLLRDLYRSANDAEFPPAT
ncbi:MAG TPA: DinB family protein [Acidimicrobiales bacterium]|nr:DinB family protein [Acidimicrobiales bacterium]